MIASAESVAAPSRAAISWSSKRMAAMANTTPSAHHRHQWRMGSAGQPVGASGLLTLSPAAQAVAVASADDAAPDLKDQGDQPVGGCLLHALSQGLCDERAKRGCPVTLPELGDLPGQICRESTDLATAHRPL